MSHYSVLFSLDLRKKVSYQNLLWKHEQDIHVLVE